MEDKILEVKNLTISYGKNCILEKESFEVHRGEIVLILGENGSGKSTLFNAILNNPPLKCSISRDLYFNGEHIDTESKLEDFKKSIAYASQDDDYAKYFGYNVWQKAFNNASFNLNFNGIFEKEKINNEIQKVYDELYCNVSYSNKEFKKIKLSKCSGGQRKLASLLACLSRTKADLFILDEPINNLDAFHARKLNNYLVKLTKQENPPGILIITHCPIFQNVSRAYKINNKHLIIIQDEEELKAKTCYGNCVKNGIYLEEKEK